MRARITSASLADGRFLDAATDHLPVAVLGSVAAERLGLSAFDGSASGWSVLVPAVAIWGGITGSILIGGVAGLYPARRAAQMAPTEALRSA